MRAIAGAALVLLATVVVVGAGAWLLRPGTAIHDPPARSHIAADTAASDAQARPGPGADQAADGIQATSTLEYNNRKLPKIRQAIQLRRLEPGGSQQPADPQVQGI
jgi:hypothetical protein